MALIRIKQLASETAAILGETLELECHPEESPFPNIEERVRVIAPLLLDSIILNAPADLLSGCKRLSASVEIDSKGVVSVPVPDDCLRIISVKMSDWELPVVNILSADHKALMYHGSRWKGIRGNPQRPAALLETSEKGRILRLFSSEANAALESALYMSRSRVDSSDQLEVPDLLYPALMKEICNFLSVENNRWTS